MKNFFKLLGFSTVAAICMALFMQIPDFTKYLFSLLAIYIGIRFFRIYETVGYRIAFVVIAIVLSLLFSVIYAFILYINTGEIKELSAI